MVLDISNFHSIDKKISSLPKESKYYRKMIELKRKRIILLQWLSIMTYICLIVYLVLNVIPFDDGEVKSIISNMIIKWSACVLTLISLIFQCIALAALSNKKQIYDNETDEIFIS